MKLIRFIVNIRLETYKKKSLRLVISISSVQVLVFCKVADFLIDRQWLTKQS